MMTFEPRHADIILSYCHYLWQTQPYDNLLLTSLIPWTNIWPCTTNRINDTFGTKQSKSVPLCTPMPAYLLLILWYQECHECYVLWSCNTNPLPLLWTRTVRHAESLVHCNSQAKWSSNRTLQSTSLSGNREGWIQISLLIIFSLTWLFKQLPKLHGIMYYKILSTEQTWFAAPLFLHQKKVKEENHGFFPM